jgi:hypothetical protein
MAMASETVAGSTGSWYGDRQALWRIGLRYLPWLAALSLAWEVAQLPLYTVWSEQSPAYIAFAVAHCTAGDLLIGTVALLGALTVLGARAAVQWRWRSIVPTTIVFATGYTVFSEWLNTAVLENWRYSAHMPTVSAGGLDVGIAPLLQWIVVPGIALYHTRKAVRRARDAAALPAWGSRTAGDR